MGSLGHGSVRVDVADAPTTAMAMFSLRVSSSMEGGGPHKGKEEVEEHEGDETDANLDAVEFSAGNPSVEVTRGTVHLFRPRREGQDENQGEKNASEQLLALAVPNHVTVADFCDYCAPFLPKINAMRILRRTVSDASYMVLLNLDSVQSAVSFHEKYNGKQYTSLETGVWSLVWVSSVEITDVESTVQGAPPGQTELPNCPVCLERLDQHISGVVTTVCNHAFHSQCLRQWADASCPVCRYCDSKQATSYCTECGTSSGLWMCLICGYIGCGRYHRQHAVEHWKSTQHCYSMELESQKVWDYVGDNYVHRIIQSKTDGKLVELPSPHAGPASSLSQEDKALEEALLASKVEAVALEYNTLLTTQLESQRQYYEGLLATAAQEAEMGTKAAVSAEKAAAVANVAVSAAKRADKELKATKKRLAGLEQQYESLRKEKEALEELNKFLLQNQHQLKSNLEVRSLEWEESEKERLREISELQDHVRDLMFFIEAKEKIAKDSQSLGHEMKGGAAYVEAGSSAMPSPRERLREKIKHARG